MRNLIIALSMLTASMSASTAGAQVSIGISVPGVSIGINLPVYPELVPVPGYPVYYAPRLNSNFFFYDGMYWVYHADNWYASSWYNGPWGLVAPAYVPLFVLRVPVRYYRSPPGYFQGWRPDAPPRWGEHWGHEWEARHGGWDRWDHKAVPKPAPLPVYQRQYSGDRYPRVEQQQKLHSQNYRYQPHESVVRQHYQEQAGQRAPAPKAGPAGPRVQPSQRGGENTQRDEQRPVPPQQRGPAVQDQRQSPQQGPGQREQQAPRTQGKGEPQQSRGNSERRQGPDQDKDQERGQGR